MVRCFTLLCVLFSNVWSWGALDESFRIHDSDLELIHVESGTFMMGSEAGETDRHHSEGPRTRVTITQDFWLGKTEVTQAQYKAIVGTNPSRFREVGPNAPVEEVSWDDAMAFCSILTNREREAGRLPEGYEYTLPTEAQWEYACRAGTKTEYAGYSTVMAWSSGNSKGRTHSVATLEPNDWGFYDMSGNVLEWCYDYFGDYPGGSVDDPSGPIRGKFRIARGGSWRVDTSVGRSAARAGGSQARRDYTIGFRLVLSSIGN